MRAFGLGLLFVSACADVNSQSLDRAVHQYNNSLRWGRFAMAAQFMPEGERASFVRRYTERESDLHIDDIAVREITPRRDPQSFDVTVVAEAYLLPRTKLEKRVMVQRWDKVNDGWVLVRAERELVP